MHQFVPEINQDVLIFCQRLSKKEKPFYVPVNVHAKATHLRCFLDVEALVAEEGGVLVSGWEITVVPKMFLEAQAHAVWKNNKGFHISISPQEIDTDRILFLPDRNLKYNNSQIPNEHFSFCDDKDLKDYLFYSQAAMRTLDESQSYGLAQKAREIRMRIQGTQNQSSETTD